MQQDERNAFVAGLIGRPYAFGANGPKEFDCYGLVAHLFRECYWINLPEVDRSEIEPTTAAVSRATARAILKSDERLSWHLLPVGAEGDGDLALMGNVDGRNYHIGVAMFIGSQFAVVHTEYPSGVTFDDIPSLRIKGYNTINYFRRS